MNIINKGFLKLALAPVGFYNRIGVDAHQLRWILTTKLVMDDRRTGVLAQARRKNNNRKVSLATLGTMFMSGLLGVFFLFAFSVGNEMVTPLTIYFSMFFFMLSLTLIADFTSVLIDVRDNFIILPKPVSDRTFVVARLLHIFIHICKIVVPMSVAGLVYMAAKHGVAGFLLLLVLVFMVTAFAILFINAAYIIILKLTTPQRFQAIISYIQIVFAIIVYASYQVFPRLLSDAHLENFNLSQNSGIVFYPIYWFASLWKCLYFLGGSSKEILAAALGSMTPFLSIYIVVKYLAPSFNNKLALITNSGAGPSKPISTDKKQSSSYPEMLSRLITRRGAERMGFLFTWKMTARSRDFKMKVYPSIGYLLVYIFIVLFSKRNRDFGMLAEDTTAARILVISAIYFTSFIMIMALSQTSFSDKYKASWIYYTAPLKKPGEIILGASKAAMMKFYIPMVVIISIAGLFIGGVKMLPNIIFGLTNQLVIAFVMVYSVNKMFPFSTPQSNDVKTGSIIRNMFVLAVSGVIAIGHFFIYSIIPAVLLCMVLSGAALWFLMDSIRNLSWTAIKSSYTEE